MLAIQTLGIVTKPIGDFDDVLYLLVNCVKISLAHTLC